MINQIFHSFVGVAAGIVKTIIVIIIVGGLLILPFGVRNGWLLALPIYGFFGGYAVFAALAWREACKNVDNDNNNENGE